MVVHGKNCHVCKEHLDSNRFKHQIPRGIFLKYIARFCDYNSLWLRILNLDMVLFTLLVKCNLEGIQTLYTSDDFTWLLKVKCSACGEESPNWHTVDAQSTVEGKGGRGTFNFLYKCKLCSRENSLDIIPASVKKIEAENCSKFSPLVTLDCRGLEPVDYTPGKGWIARAEESGTCFQDIDLSEKEWVDYDEKGQQSVGIYEFESQFKPEKSK